MTCPSPDRSSCKGVGMSKTLGGMGVQFDTPVVAGLITLAALAILILLGKGFRGVSVSLG